QNLSRRTHAFSCVKFGETLRRIADCLAGPVGDRGQRVPQQTARGIGNRRIGLSGLAHGDEITLVPRKRKAWLSESIPPPPRKARRRRALPKLDVVYLDLVHPDLARPVP